MAIKFKNWDECLGALAGTITLATFNSFLPQIGIAHWMNTKLSFAEDFTQIFQVLGLYYYFLKFLVFKC
jgi:hypothetical protein